MVIILIVTRKYLFNNGSEWVKNLKAAVLLLMGLAIFPSHASAPVPWPWPWAVGCAIQWDQIAHQYTLPDVPEGSALSISLSRVEGSSFIGVHVRRSDPNAGVHSDGFVLVPPSKPNSDTPKDGPKGNPEVVVVMSPQREDVKPYAIRIGVYLYESYKLQSCATDRLATVMSIEPLHKDEPSGRPVYNYLLQMATTKN